MKSKLAVLLLLISIFGSANWAQESNIRKPENWSELTMVGFSVRTNEHSNLEAVILIKQTGEYHMVAESDAEEKLTIVEKRGKLPEKALQRLNVALSQSNPSVRGEGGFLTWRYMSDARSTPRPGICVLIYNYIWIKDLRGKSMDAVDDAKWWNGVTQGEYDKVFVEK